MAINFDLYNHSPVKSFNAIQGQTAINCNDHPFVSIVVCTLGNRKTLQKCLDSLFRLECVHREVLLVLNGKKRKIGPWIKRFPVRTLREEKKGVSVARNTAVANANGDVVAFVDDDVVVHPGWLHALLAAFRDPKVVCSVGRVIPSASSEIPDPYTRLYFGERSLISWQQEPGTEGIRNVLEGRVIGAGCNMAFTKEFLINHVRFPEDLGAGSLVGSHDEQYMFVQVLHRGFHIAYIPLAKVTHFFTERNTQQWRARIVSAFAGSAALRMKLLVEVKELRWPIFRLMTKHTFAKLFANITDCFGAKTASEPMRLSFSKVALTYLNGFWLYCKSRSLRSRSMPLILFYVIGVVAMKFMGDSFQFPIDVGQLIQHNDTQ